MFDAGPPWVTVATFGAVFEADFVAATLEEAGIPARVTGAHLGIFGVGYQGPSLHGVEVRVPYHRAEDALRLLDSLALEEDEGGHEDDDGAEEGEPPDFPEEEDAP